MAHVHGNAKGCQSAAQNGSVLARSWHAWPIAWASHPSRAQAMPDCAIRTRWRNGQRDRLLIALILDGSASRHRLGEHDRDHRHDYGECTDHDHPAGTGGDMVIVEIS